jgi:hypothetical protein
MRTLEFKQRLKKVRSKAERKAERKAARKANFLVRYACCKIY